MTEPTLKPCDIPCPKCGSVDICRKFMRQGKSERNYGMNKPFEGGLTITSDWDTTAIVDCIKHTCRTCQYRWATEPMK